MLLGAVLHTHTNHLNITTNNTTPEHDICWFSYIEQFNPYIHFIPGKDNDIADTLSHLHCLEESALSKDKQVFVLKDSVSKGMNFANNPLLIECFLQLQIQVYKILIQQIVNGCSPNKIKLIN